MSDDVFTRALERAAVRLGKGAAITSEITDGVSTIVDAASELALKRNVDVRDLLIGDALHDSALLNAAAVQGEIAASGIDWAALPGKAFEIAFQILTTASGVAALL